MVARNLNVWATLCFVAILLVGFHPAVAQSDAQQKQLSLYDRLGGLAPISVVVNDFIDVLVPDAVLNANPPVKIRAEGYASCHST